MIEVQPAFRDDGCPELKSPVFKETPASDYEMKLKGNNVVGQNKKYYTDKKKPSSVAAEKFLNTSIQHYTRGVVEKLGSRNITPLRINEIRDSIPNNLYRDNGHQTSQNFNQSGNKNYEVQLPKIGNNIKTENSKAEIFRND